MNLLHDLWCLHRIKEQRLALFFILENITGENLIALLPFPVDH